MAAARDDDSRDALEAISVGRRSALKLLESRCWAILSWGEGRLRSGSWPEERLADRVAADPAAYLRRARRGSATRRLMCLAGAFEPGRWHRGGRA